MITLITTGCETLDARIFKKPSMWIIYGMASSGKTNLALNIIKLSKNAKILYVSTEGPLYQERLSQMGSITSKPVFAEVVSLEELLLAICHALTEHWDLVIVDSINSPFRAVAVEHKYATSAFNFILAVLKDLTMKGVHVILTAQVRAIEEEEEPSGIKFLSFWTDGMLRLERINDRRRIYLITPAGEELISEFQIVNDGIRWLKC